MSNEALQRKQLLAEAQAAEKRGDFDGAAQTYARAGSLDDAARLYLAASNFLEAGRLLLKSIGYDRKRTANLDASQRKSALKAAICFGRAGDVRQAVELYMMLGERMRAAELLRSVGDYVNATRVERATGRVDLLGYAEAQGSETAEAVTPQGAQALEKAGKLEAALEAYAHLKFFAPAARVAEALGKMGEAAGFHLQANQPLEAGLCFARLGDKANALKMLVQVPRDHERYREGCVEAIRASHELDRLEFQLDNFIGKFVSSGPQNEAEAEAFYNLGGLYQRHGVPENARECYRKLAAKRPDYLDVSDKLRILDADSRGSEGDIAKVFNEDQSFQQAVARHDSPGGGMGYGDEELPGLPDLPDLPDAPPAVGRAATIAHTGAAPLPGATPPPMAPAPGTILHSQRRHMTPAPVDPRAGRVVDSHPVDPATGRVLTPSGRADPRRGGTPPPMVQASPRPGRFATPPPIDLPTLTGTARRTMNPPVVPAADRSGMHQLPMSPSGQMGAFGPVTLTEGAVVNNRYRLEKKIGQGGMGAVFKATDLELDEIVAVKFLSAAAADEGMLQRFKQEVSLSRALNHPNIIRLYDLGTWGEHKYISMELLTGRDMSKVMGGEPMDLDTGLGYMVQACSALQAVHDRGVIHRDVKPENFFVTDDGVVKVMDFGIAKRHNASKGLTRAGMMAGTPQYMAPEQINDFGSATQLADIYSLGVIAYQMFTGVVPFDNEELMPILVAHLTTPPEVPSRRNPKIPSDLEGVIIKLLAKKPPERFQTCREVAGELARIRLQLASPRR